MDVAQHLQPKETVKYTLQCWDVSSLELNGQHHRNIFHNADGVVFVFDQRANSIDIIDQWRAVLQHHAESDPTFRMPPLYLLANKSDLGKSIVRPAQLDEYCDTGTYKAWKIVSARLVSFRFVSFRFILTKPGKPI
jgi:hypothetical protein